MAAEIPKARRIVGALGLGIEREIKRRALVCRAFGTHPPSMPGDDALHGGQTHAGAGKFTLRMQVLKWLE
ncbi:MAG: hypothetical protein ACYDBH_17720 [Acidobacteriaceae bacterium]